MVNTTLLTFQNKFPTDTALRKHRSSQRSYSNSSDRYRPRYIQYMALYKLNKAHWKHHHSILSDKSGNSLIYTRKALISRIDKLFNCKFDKGMNSSDRLGL